MMPINYVVYQTYNDCGFNEPIGFFEEVEDARFFLDCLNELKREGDGTKYNLKREDWVVSDKGTLVVCSVEIYDTVALAYFGDVADAELFISRAESLDFFNYRNELELQSDLDIYLERKGDVS